MDRLKRKSYGSINLIVGDESLSSCRIQILQMSLITLFVFIAVGKADIAFQTTNYFHAQQIRLFPSFNSSLTLYQTPIPTHPDNLSSAALALSGYDIGPNNALNFRTELSINTNANNFQILLTTLNSTRLYSMNFFMVAINKEASSWLHIQSNCFETKVAPFNPQLLNYTEQQTFKGPIQFNPEDGILVVPYINSVYTQVYRVGNYLNFSQAAPKNNTVEFYLNIYRNYSYFMSACASFLIVKQKYIQAQPFSAYAFSQKLVMRSDQAMLTLQSYARSSFGVPFPYGPILQPKCILGFHAFLIDSTQRSNLNFDISQPGVTALTASSKYLLDFSYFCLADIACPNPNQQYYPLINECQPLCSIDFCLTCSSSTSCMRCNATYFVDPLSRCSKCMANCLECSDRISCITCAVGYFYSANVCQMCSMYCLSCNLGACTQCADGYTPNGTRCISCQIVMPQCLRCSNPAQCTDCRDTFAFNSNMRSCQSCSSMMPNCLRCDLPNNCLACMPNYYKQSFSVCSACTFQVEACCPNYVANCSVCASNSTCKACLSGFTLNSTTKQCELCSLYFGQACAGCNSNGCFSCFPGFFISNDSCQTCNSTIENCLSCTNATVCLQCKESYTFAMGACLNCPVWPLNSLYFIDQANSCRECSLSQPYCSRCTIKGVCLSCIDTHFLNVSGECQLCLSVIPLCVACKDMLACSQCQSSYFVNISNPLQCLSCSAVVDNCLECKMMNPASSNSPHYQCMKCQPQYFPSELTLQCTLCSSAISNCLECINSRSCLTCLQSYYLTAQGRCADCSSILPGCASCLSRNVCQACQDGYVLQGSYCTQCTILLSNCRSCRSDISGKPVCGACTRGFYLAGNTSCLRCKDRDQLCSQCNSNTCTSCLSTYYVSPSGSCKKCYELIGNCDYCTPDLVCRSCLPGFVYNPVDFSCKRCAEYASGCQSCNFTIDNTTLDLNVSCLTCLQGYIFLRSQNNSSACFLCSSIIVNCQQCLSPNQCGKCQNISFINPSGTCSRCQLYLAECIECTSSSNCVTCSAGYTLNASNACVKCDLTRFGVNTDNQTLCTECNAKITPATCTKCTDQAYLLSSGSGCVLCQRSIPHCKSCLGSSRCINCLPAYYLSLDGSSCQPCSFQSCAVCTSSSCLSCVETSFLSDNKCISCSKLIVGCFRCNSSVCTECSDGYYLKEAACISCQQIDRSCVLCSEVGVCLVSDPNRVTSGHSETVKTLGIISLSGLGVAIIEIFVVIGFLCKRRKGDQEGQQSQPKTETSRRMSQDQIYEQELEIKDNKLCHFCNRKPPELMRVELLCNECDSIQNRGPKHKILKDLRRDYVDRIKEEEEDLDKRVTLVEYSNSIDKAKQNPIKQTKNIKRQPQLGIESFVPAHSTYHKTEKEETLKIQSTKVASSDRSKRIRDMF